MQAARWAATAVLMRQRIVQQEAGRPRETSWCCRLLVVLVVQPMWRANQARCRLVLENGDCDMDALVADALRHAVLPDLL